MNSVESARRIRVLVLYNESIVAAGLCAILGQEADLELHAGARSEASGGPFDVALCDYDTGVALAQAAPRHAGKADGEPPALILTPLSSETAVVQAMALGVRGYLLLGSPLAELLTALRELARGRRYVSPAVAHRLVDHIGREALTAREDEVLRLLGRGEGNKSIARELDISLGTVKTHVKAILAKLDAQSRTHAVTVAAHRGLITLAPVASPSLLRARSRGTQAPQSAESLA